VYVTDPIIHSVRVSFPEGLTGTATVSFAPSPVPFIRDAAGEVRYVGPVPARIARFVLKLRRRGWTDGRIADFLGYSHALLARLREELAAEGERP
jgi:hypothetical protein